MKQRADTTEPEITIEPEIIMTVVHSLHMADQTINRSPTASKKALSQAIKLSGKKIVSSVLLVSSTLPPPPLEYRWQSSLFVTPILSFPKRRVHFNNFLRVGARA